MDHNGDQNETELARVFLGRAKVQTRHVLCGTKNTPVPSNAKRFQTHSPQEYRREEKVPVLIDRCVLDNIIAHNGLSLRDLQQPPIRTLVLPQGIALFSRLEFGTNLLNPRDEWCVVDLYCLESSFGDQSRTPLTLF
jgi:hypothetical protein